VKEGEGEGEGEEEEERVVCETADDNATEHARADNRDEAQPAGPPHAEPSSDTSGGLIFLNEISPAR